VLPREGTKEGENATTKRHVKLLQIKSMTLKSNVMMIIMMMMMMMIIIIIIIIIIIMRYGIKGYTQRSYSK